MRIASTSPLVKRSTLSIAPPKRSPRASMRGFTLVELLAAIVIIALLAALATPSFIRIMRDRRVTQVGISIADTYREARSRALARGIAVAVRWQSTGGGKGKLEMRETLVLPPGQGITKSCHTADFGPSSADTRRVSLHDFNASIYELAVMKLVTESGSDSQFGETCFAPDGRTWIRYADGAVFLQQTGVPRFEVVNSQTNNTRVVFLPPNGIARLAL